MPGLSQGIVLGLTICPTSCKASYLYEQTCSIMVWQRMIVSRKDYGRYFVRTCQRTEIHFDGSVEDCSNSIANALELLQSYTKPSIYSTWLFCGFWFSYVLIIHIFYCFRSNFLSAHYHSTEVQYDSYYCIVLSKQHIVMEQNLRYPELYTVCDSNMHQLYYDVSNHLKLNCLCNSKFRLASKKHPY